MARNIVTHPGKYPWQELLKSPQALIFVWSPSPFSKFGTESCPPSRKGGGVILWSYSGGIEMEESGKNCYANILQNCSPGKYRRVHRKRRQFWSSFLTHFNPIFHFCTPWKRQKTKSFQPFSGGIEMEHWAKMD